MAGSVEIGEETENPVAINAVALVDVIFCLCVFFMCSFHFKQVEGKIETWMPRDGGIDWSKAVLEDIRVMMRWDPQTGTTTRKFGGRQLAQNDAELQAGLEARADDYKKAGRTRIPVLIDAAADVPWTDVVHLIDLCRAMGLPEVEFTAP